MSKIGALILDCDNAGLLMSRKKQMGYYRYRDWSKLRSLSRSCEMCVKDVGRWCKAGRKELSCVFGADVFGAYGRGGPLGTDSRQWAGIIWWMRLLRCPLHHLFFITRLLVLALFLSLRWSERGGICYILHYCQLVCVTAGLGDFGKTRISLSLCSASLQRRSSSLRLCCSPCEGV